MQKRVAALPGDRDPLTGQEMQQRQPDWLEIRIPVEQHQLDTLKKNSQDGRPRAGWLSYVADYKAAGGDAAQGIPIRSVSVWSVDPNPLIYGEVLGNHNEKGIRTAMAGVAFLFKDWFVIGEHGVGVEFSYRDWLFGAMRTALANPAGKSAQVTFEFAGSTSLVLNFLWDGKDFVDFDFEGFAVDPKTEVRGLQPTDSTLNVLESNAGNVKHWLQLALERGSRVRPK